MIIRANRHIIRGPETIGTLTLPSGFQCYTLEDSVRDLKADGSGKVYGETAIPIGTYEVRLTMSKRFGIVTPEIIGVPFFSGIRIHSGSTKEHTMGCVLVGEQAVAGEHWTLRRSKKAFEVLMAMLEYHFAQDDKVMYHITEEMGG